jgi:hypothetical protein
MHDPKQQQQQQQQQQPTSAVLTFGWPPASNLPAALPSCMMLLASV